MIKGFVSLWVPERAANSLITGAQSEVPGWAGRVWSVVCGLSGLGVVGGTLGVESWAGRWRCNRVNDRAGPRPRSEGVRAVGTVPVVEYVRRREPRGIIPLGWSLNTVPAT